jgi:iron complex transport system ATP-binding protein
MYPHTRFLGTLSAAQQSKVTQVCQLCSIDDALANQPLNALSDGEYQRVSLATAICQQTPFILLDEPTAHLDVVQRQATFELLKRLAHEQNIGIIICSHEIHLILRYTDTLILLGGDGTYTYGQSSELAHNPTLHRIFPIF